MEEVWKKVSEFEDYEVSNTGQLRSIKKGKTKLLNKKYDPNGYLMATLCKNGIRKYFRLHRLIAIEFIPNPNNHPIVNHIDQNKANACVSNLEWCTHSHNIKESIRISKRKIYSPTRGKFDEESPMNKKVGKFDLEGNLLEVFCSSENAERKTNKLYMQSGISKACRQQIKYKNFIWKHI